MNIRNDLMRVKKLEIRTIIEDSYLKEDGKNLNILDIEESLFNSGCLKITAPEEKDPIIQMITLDSLNNFKNAQTIKPGNIKLNMKNLINSFYEIGQICLGIDHNRPISNVYAALNIWKYLKGLSTVKITKEEAIVIMSLWRNCDSNYRITIEVGFDKANLFCKNMLESTFTWDQYLEVLDNLEKIKTISYDMYGICLVENVKKDYR